MQILINYTSLSPHGVIKNYTSNEINSGFPKSKAITKLSLLIFMLFHKKKNSERTEGATLFNVWSRGFVTEKTRAGKHKTTLNQKKQDTNIKNFKDNT